MTDVVEIVKENFVEIVVNELKQLEIISQGPKGNKGDKGDRGDAGVNYVTKTASGSIGAHRFVISNSDGSVSYASQSNLAHLGKVVGITLNSANDAENVDIQLLGYITFNGWDFDDLLPIYLADNGLINQILPMSGFSQIVGFAESSDTIFINLREPIILGD